MKKQKGLVHWLLLLAVVIVALFAAYTWLVLSWSYSDGERAGYVQKFSKKGWLCKTWEGELAIINIPGTLTEKFYFTVHDDEVVRKINDTLGKKVSLVYDEHVGIPSTCFGDTGYFVSDLRVVE
ncbi:hypothetical protein MTYP_00979 [Methylophilaceae bacterium]|nr:hypothetical protein MTYP_00979 [Methylophilaceae bacterium]